MALPRDIAVIDTMMGSAGRRPPLVGQIDGGAAPRLRKPGRVRSRGELYVQGPAGRPPDEDPVAALLAEMDGHGIELALVPVSFADETSLRALREHPDRILGSFMVNPNRGMESSMNSCARSRNSALSRPRSFPADRFPQVPIDDRKAFPVYAKCTQLDIPIFVNAGVPGPRVPMEAQNVNRVDEICWFFPDLRVVLRHGAEPWAELAVKLMIKWPNLYYSTSAFAPALLPEGHRRFRQHLPRRRPDHLRRLLPVRADPRPDL